MADGNVALKPGMGPYVSGDLEFDCVEFSVRRRIPIARPGLTRPVLANRGIDELPRILPDSRLSIGAGPRVLVGALLEQPISSISIQTLKQFEDSALNCA